MSFKKLIASAVISMSLLYGSPSVAAGSCGIGTVIEVREGGFDSDDLYLLLDYTSPPNDQLIGTTWRSRWIRYQAQSLSAERLNALRSLAYLAFVTGNPVYTYSHNPEGCRDATEFSLFSEGVDPTDNGIDELPN